jgi:hypothetical protein
MSVVLGGSLSVGGWSEQEESKANKIMGIAKRIGKRLIVE